MWYRMPTALGRFKNGAAIERSLDLSHLVILQIPGVAVKADGALPSGVPVLVQIDEHIDAPALAGLRMDVEVAVRVEPGAGEALMGTAAEIARVVAEAFDPAERLHGAQEGRRLDCLVKREIDSAEAPYVGDRRARIGLAELVLEPARVGAARKLGEHRFGDLGHEEIVDDDMAKRPAARELRARPSGRRLSIVCGDRVRCSRERDEILVVEVLPRTTLLARANLRLDIAAESNSFEFLRGMVLRGKAISFQIEIGVVETDELVVREIDNRDVPRADLVLGQLRGRNLPVPAAKFAEQLARVLEGMRR